MIRGVIFDVDGTLLNSMPVWEQAGERYLLSQGKTAERGLAKRLFSMSLEESAAYLKGHYLPELSPEEIIQGIEAVISGFYEKEVMPKPGAEELMRELKGRHIPAVAATSGRQTLVEAAFGRLGISGYFKRILTCSEIGKGKTEPDIFLAAADVIGAAPEEIWVFEDSLYAVRTAVQAGFRTVGVYDEASKEDLEWMKTETDLFLYEWSESGAFWRMALQG